MLKNITFSAEEKLIQAARERAQGEKTTLNRVFRQWLSRYAAQTINAREYARIMSSLQEVSPGRRFDRDELNER